MKKSNSILITLSALVAFGCGPLQRPLPMSLSPDEVGTLLVLGTDQAIEPKTVLGEVPTSEGQRGESSPRRLEIGPTRDGIAIGVSTGEGPIAGTDGQGNDGRGNESRSFVPASIAKIITAFVALKSLGGDFRYSTRVAWTPEGGDGAVRDLLVIADGDPQPHRLASVAGPERARLSEIARELKRRGVRSVRGRVELVSADGRLDVAIHPPGLDPEDHLACYGALAQAFNFESNCVGQSSASSTKQVYARALLRELERQGIAVRQVAISYPVTTDADVSRASWELRQPVTKLEMKSDPVQELIVHMNKVSDNLIADALFKSVGVRSSSKALDPREAGEGVTRAALLEWLHGAGRSDLAPEMRLVDGTGLSRESFVTPRALVTVMRRLAREPSFALLWNSLPIAGRDGTLRGRMNGTKAEGFVRAKTGTVRGAYQLAGYVPKIGSRGEIVEYVPFVILSDTTPANRERVRRYQDQLVVRLVELINPGKF